MIKNFKVKIYKILKEFFSYFIKLCCVYKKYTLIKYFNISNFVFLS